MNEAPILIVEDSDDDYEATVRALKRNDNVHNPIYRCETGEEVLDFFKCKDMLRPCIILLDLNIPGLDGREVLKTIKTRKELKKIPIVVLTTSEDERDIEDCYEYGANTYIKKPVNLENFILIIKSLKEYWLNIAMLPKK